eukprot:3863725-Heterocapsa_arctica.AAC.1
MKDCWLRRIEVALGHECVVIDAASFGWHHRRRVWVANFSLPPDVAKWLKRVGGRREAVLPVAARKLTDLGRIFNGGFFPKFLRGAASKAFPEGRFPCLSKPLRPGMFPRGWKEASQEARDR